MIVFCFLMKKRVAVNVCDSDAWMLLLMTGVHRTFSSKGEFGFHDVLLSSSAAPGHLCASVASVNWKQYTQLPQDGLVNHHWNFPAGNGDLGITGILNVTECEEHAFDQNHHHN